MLARYQVVLPDRVCYICPLISNCTGMKLHTLQGYIQHIYLVESEQGLLLLDGCSRADVGNVCQFVKQELKRNLSDLKLIVVTHMHPDHAGGAHALRQRTGAKIACHPKAPGWYSGMAGRAAHLIDVALTWYVASRLSKPKRHIWYPAILKPDVLLAEGQALPVFSDWQVHYTPGHTDHDISLCYKPEGMLYVADLMVKVKGALTPPYPLCHPNQYRASLQKVADMPVSTLLFAHVKPMAHDTVEFAGVLQRAPVKPSNHWHASKNRIRGLFNAGKSQF